MTAAVAPVTTGLHTQRFSVSVPVVLAPMAGITNSAFRRLCREYGAGLYVSEMVTSRGLVEGHPESLAMVRPEAVGVIKSIQLYGVDPVTIGQAVTLLVARGWADHIDLNMGCPVAKVTRRGGGAALPWKTDLFTAIVSSAVVAAHRAADERGEAPPAVTVKMRMGIDDDHLTYRRAGVIAAEAGVSWVALHARTAAEMYAPSARWEAIADLVALLAGSGVPVLGNGDIWSAADALAMVAQTGCAGVVIGRGCLGRPWLFGQLAAAFTGAPMPPDPALAEVVAIMQRHALLLCQRYGHDRGCRDFRKHVAWYLKGFEVGSQTRRALGMVSSLPELTDLLGTLPADQPYPAAVVAQPRGRTTPARPVALPHGWLDTPTLEQRHAPQLRQAEECASGG